MVLRIAEGILIPFLGTALGSACVFFLRGPLGRELSRGLTGFAAGVMTAASVWSLLIPALRQSAGLGRWGFLPAAAGLWLGVLFLRALDRIIPHLHPWGGAAEGPPSRLSRTAMLVLAVVLHNLPEGMAVGAVFAGVAAGSGAGMAGAMILALGIAIQNFPEGAIISLPLRGEGMAPGRSFWMGVLSGAVEPVGAVLVLLAAELLTPAMPVFLSFAAGAMLFVVAEDLLPEAGQGKHSDLGALWFCAGFTVMMVLDVALS